MADAVHVSEVVADTTKAVADLNRAAAAFTGLDTSATKAMADVQKATAGLEKSSKQVAGSIAGVSVAGRQTQQTFNNLANSAETLNKSMGGVTTAGMTLATTIGVVIGNAIGAAVRELVQAVVQFGQLHNELAQTPALMGNVGRAFEFTTQMARENEATLADTVKQYVNLSQRAQELGISQGRVNQLMEDWNETLKLTQISTVSGSLSRLGTAFGGMVVGLDNATGVSSLFTMALNKLAAGFEYLADKLPKSENALERLRREAALTEMELRHLDQTGAQGITSIDGQTRSRLDLVNALRKQRSEINMIEGGYQRSPEDMLRGEAFLRRTMSDLTSQETMRGYNPVKERITAQYREAIEELARLQGVVSTDVMNALQSKITTANLIPQIEPLIASLRTVEEAEAVSYSRRLELLKMMQDARVLTETEYNNIVAGEAHRHGVAMQQIALQSAQMHFQAISGAMQEAQALLGVFAGKNKAAAIAAIVVQKALAIAQVAMNIPVAQARALAELGPIAGAAMAANIGAWGAVQMGLIAATGLGQIASLGGSAPSGGGGGSSDSSGSVTGTETTNMAPPTRAIHITLEPHKLYSAEQMTELIDALNNETQNGATLIATSVMGS